jgi:hypothetical protein
MDLSAIDTCPELALLPQGGDAFRLRSAELGQRVLCGIHSQALWFHVV